MYREEKAEILSLSKDLGEIGLDSLLKDGIFKDIPVLGTILSVSKLCISVSDKILLSKLIHFINDLNLNNQQEIDDFKEKYFKDENYTKIGSKILLILERSDNETKINWLAKSLRLFVDKKINRYQFLRVSSIINSAYIEDIEKIIVFNVRHEITSQNDLIETYILDHLFSVGLLESHGFEGGGYNGENAGTIYALNEFGEIFINDII